MYYIYRDENYRPFFRYPSYALHTLGRVLYTRAALHTRAARGLIGAGPGLLMDAHAASTRRTQLYTLYCRAYALHNMRSMHVCLHIVLISRLFSIFSELLRENERHKIDIWWRSLFERIHIPGIATKYNIYLHGCIPADLLHLLLNKEIPHTNQLICTAITHALLG